jgi:hypothetical protein
MSAPVTLIVLVAAGSGSDPTTHTMAATTRDALGPSAHVVVRETRSEPIDAEALAVEQSDRASAVVELSWGDSRHKQANLRMHVARTGRWIDRSIAFRPSDADSERWRTIGFAIASILPEAPTEGAQSSPSITSAPPTGTPPAPRPAPDAAAETAGAAAETPAPAPGGTSPTSTTASTAAAAAATADRESAVEQKDANAATTTSPLFAIDVLGTATGIGGDAGSIGGGAAIHWFLYRPFSLRLGGGIRGGSVPAAEATTLTTSTSVGVVFHAWRAMSDRAFGGSLRVDCLLLEQAMTHFVPGGPKQSRDELRPGLEVFVDGSWRFAPDVEAILGVGLEDVFAPTYVNLQGARAATLPALRASAEAGLRLRL